MVSKRPYIDLAALTLVLVVLSVFLGYTGLWEFAFSSLVGWSLGSLLFKYLERNEIEEEGEAPFIVFVMVVIAFSIAGALFSTLVEEGISSMIGSNSELTHSFIHLPYQPRNVGYSGAALVYYTILSFIAGVLALTDFWVKKWPQLHFPRYMRGRQPLKSERD